MPQQETITNYTHFPYKEENDGQEGWICGRGVAIRRNKTNTTECFCPPSLYGEYCQHFSDRITIITSLYNIPQKLLEQSSNTIKILASLLSDDSVIDYYIFHVPLIFSKNLNKKFRFNLIHSRPKILSESYTVRFEAYHLSVDSSIKFISVWEYPIHFPFLPSYRLAQVLKFENDQTISSKPHICHVANPCRHESTCHPVMNKLNNMSAYYCRCNTNSFGKQCEQLLAPSSSSSICSKHALLYLISPSKSICLCPTYRYGPTCSINHTCVYKNPCGVNRGKCYNNPDNLTRDYICVCDKKFFGDHCEFDSAVIRINFTDFVFVQSPSNFIMSSIIQLCDLHNKTFDLIVREKRVYQGLPSHTTEIFHNNHYLPMLAIMKLYHKQQLSNDYVANLKQPAYFILYITPFKVSHMNLTSIINMTNYCPHTAIAFQKNISDASYLSEYECSGRCRAGGQCIHGDLDDRKDFVCLCPRCYYGSVCQHNTELFSFTLETLLTDDLYSPSDVVRRLFSRYIN
ncbi:unnamed protein product [Rotaria sordida]|uniref:EGF-like domain-containing protein n=1 Tax=Rotaria sordida TaxID=392033 RepID=A0A815MST0_9BILA|nr:unnamed protein product [Rotaria sordida]